jgi:hypothetical protein
MPQKDPECSCCPLEWEESDEEILNLDDEVEVTVASDSGCICHVIGPDGIPRKVRPRVPEHGKLKNFVGAGGDGIKNHGKVDVKLIQEDGSEANSTFNVADVTRPLHSTGMACDENKEVLYTKTEAVVVPGGALSRFLGAIKRIATYKRENGGLYLAKMKIRARPDHAKGNSAEKPFGRQGSAR